MLISRFFLSLAWLYDGGSSLLMLLLEIAPYTPKSYLQFLEYQTKSKRSHGYI